MLQAIGKQVVDLIFVAHLGDIDWLTAKDLTFRV